MKLQQFHIMMQAMTMEVAAEEEAEMAAVAVVEAAVAAVDAVAEAAAVVEVAAAEEVVVGVETDALSINLSNLPSKLL